MPEGSDSRKFLEASEDEAPSIRRIIDPDELREAFEGAADVSEEIRDMILWGVYGDYGELVRVTEARDVEPLEANEPDARAFQKLYLKGLQEEPSSFGSTFEIEGRKSLDQVVDFLKNNHVVGVRFGYKNREGERAQKLVAMAAYKRLEGVQSHIATIGKVYVHPAHRKRAIARSMMDSLLAKAEKDRIEQVHLIVTASNTFAIKFYEDLGFEGGEIQHKAIKIDDQYYDWLPMKLSMKEYIAGKTKSSGML